ncbi:hypothetical protein [Streptomyces rubellomurinus]|uniref:COG1470 family protein n=1 Tax=Streptomyces rubellomurinus (strain ATCC 31215) TaxID=359131 RepID=UPI00099D0423|nr:hypothetical protein [Streptomyces rubellomurinus]
MTTTSAHLDPSTASVLPGEEAQLSLEVRNGGELVEAYRFEVLGPAGAWTVVDPETLSLYPGTAGRVVLKFRPPRESSTSAGPVAFGVRVLPQERPDEAVVPEGVVEVLPFDGLTAELTPRMSQGRGRGRHQVAVDNRGNRPVSVTLAGSDRRDALTFAVPSAATTVEPGRAAFVRSDVRPRRRVWRGQDMPHAFQVVVTPAEGEPIPLDGTYLQQPMAPRGLLKTAIAVAVVAGALAGMWFGVLRPAVRSTAKNAVAGSVTAAQSQASEAKQKAADAQGAAAAAQQAAAGAQQAAGGGASGSPRPAASPGTGLVPAPGAALFSQRLKATAPAGATHAESYQVPDGKTLRLTDLVLENPQGDSGTITIAVGDTPLLAPALENFREQDFHWASPILIGEKQKLTVTVTCGRPGQPLSGPAPSDCSAAALLSGSLE